VVCGQVVDVVGDDIAGSDPVELVYACKAVVYDGCLSTLLSLEYVGGRGGKFKLPLGSLPFRIMYPMLLSILRSSLRRCPEDARPVTVPILAGAGGWRRRDVASRVIFPFRWGTVPSGSIENDSSCSPAT
jgi:hypothetical protein